MRIFPTLLLLIIPSLSCLGQDFHHFGIFGGFTLPLTLDKGLEADPRFKRKLTIRGIPIGLSYGYNFGTKVGIIATPSYVQVGQQYFVSNISGGDAGTRNIRMDYICLPVAVKLNIATLSIARLSLMASLNLAYLADGKETLSFVASTLDYPESVKIPNEPGYFKKPDGGVATPDVREQVHVDRDKFNSLQLFGGLGIRSDIYVSENWIINLDARAHYGFFDSRTADYKASLREPSDVPDLPGQRNDLYLSVELGLSRLIQVESTARSRIIPKQSNSPIKKQKFKRPKW